MRGSDRKLFASNVSIVKQISCTHHTIITGQHVSVVKQISCSPYNHHRPAMCQLSNKYQSFTIQSSPASNVSAVKQISCTQHTIITSQQCVSCQTNIMLTIQSSPASMCQLSNKYHALTIQSSLASNVSAVKQIPCTQHTIITGQHVSIVKQISCTQHTIITGQHVSVVKQISCTQHTIITSQQCVSSQTNIMHSPYNHHRPAMCQLSNKYHALNIQSSLASNVSAVKQISCTHHTIITGQQCVNCQTNIMHSTYNHHQPAMCQLSNKYHALNIQSSLASNVSIVKQISCTHHTIITSQQCVSCQTNIMHTPYNHHRPAMCQLSNKYHALNIQSSPASNVSVVKQIPCTQHTIITSQQCVSSQTNIMHSPYNHHRPAMCQLSNKYHALNIQSSLASNVSAVKQISCTHHTIITGQQCVNCQTNIMHSTYNHHQPAMCQLSNKYHALTIQSSPASNVSVVKQISCTQHTIITSQQCVSSQTNIMHSPYNHNRPAMCQLSNKYHALTIQSSPASNVSVVKQISCTHHTIITGQQCVNCQTNIMHSPYNHHRPAMCQ